MSHTHTQFDVTQTSPPTARAHAGERFRHCANTVTQTAQGPEKNSANARRTSTKTVRTRMKSVRSRMEKQCETRARLDKGEHECGERPAGAEAAGEGSAVDLFAPAPRPYHTHTHARTPHTHHTRTLSLTQHPASSERDHASRRASGAGSK
eukprot:3934578-Rhodomonas_salina.1